MHVSEQPGEFSDRTIQVDPSLRAAFGPNLWLVDDMAERFRSDPTSVPPDWRALFGGEQPSNTPVSSLVAPATMAEVATTPAPAPVAVTTNGSTSSSTTNLVALRGVAARIASNMVASLSVPTATSVRSIPARLLELNRARLNEHLARTSGTKVSFTHLIGYAVVKALGQVPALNAAYVDGPQPSVRKFTHVGFGLAVDVARPDGSRGLMVPCINEADTLEFSTFVRTYDDAVQRVVSGKAAPDDFVGVTVSLTNPGTLGTVQSVPRLMPGQGAIIGVGALTNPPGFEAADPQVLASLGAGRIVTLTSTYDHRIIQGAESGLFLAYVAECLTGRHGFYEEVFSSMSVPSEPLHWEVDHNVVDYAADEIGAAKQRHVQSLINMYRVRGHLMAHLDPLDAEPPAVHPELDPETYGLSIWDLGRRFSTDGLAGKESATLEEILSILRDAYCSTLTIEYMHIQDPLQKRWVQEQLEGVATGLTSEDHSHILDRLNAAEAFERFLHTRYVGQKRFGLEGAESLIVMLDALLCAAVDDQISDAVLGMAHRGRLNVLANTVGKSYREIFGEFEGNLDPESVQGSGDVKYHKGASGTFVSPSGSRLKVTMASNPSHLEAVNPVVEGIARAKQDRVVPPSDGTQRPTLSAPARFPVMAVLIHGDAAFAGQGVVAETLNLSGLSGYRIGGAIHVVVNNQLGFTTAPEAARSSVYPTDVAKMVQSPIIHVNGDDPEACVRAARLAFAFRQQFHKDVVIDMVCYRRLGHNEGDDPSYTQPLMYKRIDAKKPVRELYTSALVRRGDITNEAAEEAISQFNARLQAALDEVRAEKAANPPKLSFEEYHAPSWTPIESGASESILRHVYRSLSRLPEHFTVHPKLARQFQQRDALIGEGVVDWAVAEQLAFGSLLVEGIDVRLSGQDSRRGTFSHRHAVLVDYETGSECVPLSHIEPLSATTGRFTVRDSLLSEYAVMGFEYGYSLEAPRSLVCWEAQFGDFANGASIVIDNFLVAAEDKWGQHAGLVLLLPHGYEGQGPEHSSARLERFLTLCAKDNVRVANPSSASQYFHLLRDQVLRQPARPLVVIAPKSGLRAPAYRSPLASLTSGGFHRVLDDESVRDANRVRRVVLCSGKVAHEAIARREERRRGEGPPPVAPGDRRSPYGPDQVAIVRVDQLHPWPKEEITSVLARYSAAQEVLWLQEEPENMGAWSYVHGRLHALVEATRRLRHVSRSPSASPATGSAALSQLEQADLLDRAIG